MALNYDRPNLPRWPVCADPEGARSTSEARWEASWRARYELRHNGYWPRKMPTTVNVLQPRDEVLAQARQAPDPATQRLLSVHTELDAVCARARVLSKRKAPRCT